MYNTIHEYAQYYQSLGFLISPCHTVDSDGKCTCKKDCHSPGKHPMTRSGVKDATNDPQQIEKWFQNNDCNIGIATGEVSEIIVIDDDDIVANEPLAKSFPKTWGTSTREGRRQFYFRYDERCKHLKNTAKFSGTQFDCRNNGGYVIAPPSHHFTGVDYKWIVSPNDCEIADAPDWLLQLIPSHEDEKPKVERKVAATKSVSYDANSNE